MTNKGMQPIIEEIMSDGGFTASSERQNEPCL